MQEQLTSHKSSKENPIYTLRRVLILKKIRFPHGKFENPKYHVLYKSWWQVHKEGNFVSPSGNPLKRVVSNPIEGANKCNGKTPRRFISSVQIRYPWRWVKKPLEEMFLKTL